MFTLRNCLTKIRPFTSPAMRMSPLRAFSGNAGKDRHAIHIHKEIVFIIIIGGVAIYYSGTEYYKHWSKRMADREQKGLEIQKLVEENQTIDYSKALIKGKASPSASPSSSSKGVDYKQVEKKIASILENGDYDDGSYGPLLVRLAWHASGTYDAKTGTGGSNGSTMRFAPESTDGANAGLHVARDLLEKVKKEYPGISYADLWTLAGVVAIKEMGGPSISWTPGRTDDADDKRVPPNGRLPDATKKSDHLRDIFYRMGFNDQEIVALSGAHALGRCHTDRSGFTGPWTRSPTTFSNDYFKLLVNTKWTAKKWKGPQQFEDPTGDLMMLPSDLALIEDAEFKKYVELYAKDEELFFKDFAAAFSKLLHLGVKKP